MRCETAFIDNNDLRVGRLRAATAPAGDNEFFSAIGIDVGYRISSQSRIKRLLISEPMKMAIVQGDQRAALRVASSASVTHCRHALPDFEVDGFES